MSAANSSLVRYAGKRLLLASCGTYVYPRIARLCGNASSTLHRNSHSRLARPQAAGVADILAVDPSEGMLGVLRQRITDPGSLGNNPGVRKLD